MAANESRNSIFLIAVPSLLLVGLMAVMGAADNWRAEPEPQPVLLVAAQDQSVVPGPEWYEGTDADKDHCDVSLTDVRHAPRFEDYPAHRSISRPVQPMLNNALAREFRTVLRQGITDGPDFAGDATIVRWGCGSSCYRWAIVDDRTGRVYAPPGEIGMMFGPSYFSDAGLHYRPDSRLLVVAGPTLWPDPRSPTGGQWYEGASYLEWTGRSLRTVRIVPVADLCAQHGAPLPA